MDKLFGHRLRQARIMKGLSMDQLAVKLNGSITKQSIYKYENSLMLPSSSVLLALADALDVNPDFFFIQPEYKVNEISFRKKSSSAKDDSMMTEIVTETAERYFYIENILHDSETDNISDDLESPIDGNPIQAAQFIRKKWNIGNDAIVSTSSLLEKKGIKVIFLNAHADFDGMSGYVNHEKPIIILNGNNNSERIRFSAMHELGHLILGNAYTKASVNETRCHEFASEMLIPSEAFIFIIGKKRKEITINELISIQEQYGISISTLMRKALNLKIITKYDYDKYKGRYNNDPEFRLTCDESRFTEYRSEKFENMVYRALSEGLISESKASALLKKDVAEIRNNIW